MCGTKSDDRTKRVNEAVKLYKSGLTCAEVGKVMNLSKSAIGKYLKTARVPRRGNYKYSYRFIEMLGEEYESGSTSTELAEKYGIPKTYVRKLLMNYGYSRKEIESWV